MYDPYLPWSLENELVQIFQEHPTLLTQTIAVLKFSPRERTKALFPDPRTQQTFLTFLENVEFRVDPNSGGNLP